ncbi:unnamed protein product [Linum tenue]|uniref:Uncharacterized protein n=1 Tax=Linum tenue TaxID=586396 RepID=A0AAV0Q797_9ROSI|nr:unnamed protein product [Linum tenue]
MAGESNQLEQQSDSGVSPSPETVDALLEVRHLFPSISASFFLRLNLLSSIEIRVPRFRCRRLDTTILTTSKAWCRMVFLSILRIHSEGQFKGVALHMAAANGHLQIVKYLIDQGVDVNASNEEKNTALHWACLNGHSEVVKKLILAGASLCSLNSHERTPMDEAVTRGKMDVVDSINEAVAQRELSGVAVS